MATAKRRERLDQFACAPMPPPSLISFFKSIEKVSPQVLTDLRETVLPKYAAAMQGRTSDRPVEHSERASAWPGRAISWADDKTDTAVSEWLVKHRILEPQSVLDTYAPGPPIEHGDRADN